MPLARKRLARDPLSAPVGWRRDRRNWNFQTAEGIVVRKRAEFLQVLLLGPLECLLFSRRRLPVDRVVVEIVAEDGPAVLLVADGIEDVLMPQDVRVLAQGRHRLAPVEVAELQEILVPV